MNELKGKRYSTAEVMKIFNLGRNALRLYEEMELLTSLTRTESGYREFEGHHLEELKFILEAKKVGFTLNEIKELLHVIQLQKKMTCGAISSEISGKLDEIDFQLKTLKAKKTFLSDFANTCSSKSKDSECNIISAGFTKNACCD